MSQRLSSDPVTVAAALRGAFEIVAARIQARTDSRLADNEIVADAVCELTTMVLDKMDERAARDRP